MRHSPAALSTRGSQGFEIGVGYHTGHIYCRNIVFTAYLRIVQLSLSACDGLGCDILYRIAIFYDHKTELVEGSIWKSFIGLKGQNTYAQ